MPAKPKRPRDVTKIAVAIVQETTGQAAPSPDPDAGKDPKAVDRGRKGGKGRASKMTPEERSEAARAAVNARWEKKDSADGE